MQAWVELQSVVHWPEPVSQAIPVGQSAVAVQALAHVPPAGGPVTAKHVFAEPAVQSAQVSPSEPQEASAVPTLQVPFRQQPPLQVWPAAQLVVQVLEPVSQA